MLQISNKYLPPLWESLDNIDGEVDTFTEGMLVEWTRYDDENEIGVGVIKNFSKQRFYDYDRERYVMLDCAYVTNANPNDPYGYYIPMTHMDTISLSDYIAIYKDEYDATLSELRDVRHFTATKMQAYGWQRGHGDMSQLFHIANLVSFQGGAK